MWTPPALQVDLDVRFDLGTGSPRARRRRPRVGVRYVLDESAAGRR